MYTDGPRAASLGCQMLGNIVELDTLSRICNHAPISSKLSFFYTEMTILENLESIHLAYIVILDS